MKIVNGFFGKLFSQESSITDVLQGLKYVSRFYVLLVYLLACLTFSCIMLKMAKHTKKHTSDQKNGVHFKVGLSHTPRKIVLFASMKAL